MNLYTYWNLSKIKTHIKGGRFSAGLAYGSPEKFLEIKADDILDADKQFLEQTGIDPNKNLNYPRTIKFL